MQGLAVAKAAHHQMLKDVIGGVPVSQVLMEETDDIRRRLHAALSVPSESASIVLFPSGSDAELIPSITALVRSHTLSARDGKSSSAADSAPHRARVFNFIAGAGEVGSGTARASGGRHFSDTPNSKWDITVRDGRDLDGMTQGAAVEDMS
jgi:hypothetical protein